ncbi:hypothetical protein EBZ39_08400 [bacterium]|nr:hypothetical protein [bacterium]
MPERKKIIYRPFDGSKPIKMSVPDGVTEEQIHQKANEILLKRSIEGRNSTELDDAQTQQMQQSGIGERPERPSITSELADAAGNLGVNALQGLGSALDFADRYSGAASLRSAAYDVAKNKLSAHPIDAALNQYGKEGAPTGKEIATELGVTQKGMSDLIPSLYSDTGNEWTKFKRGGALDFTGAGAAGLLTEMALDPLAVGMPAEKGLSAVLGKVGLPTVGRSVGKLGQASDKLFAYLGNAATGISRRDFRTYIKRPGPIVPGIRTLGDAAESASKTVLPKIATPLEAAGMESAAKPFKSFAESDPVEEYIKKYGPASNESSLASAVGDTKHAMWTRLKDTRRALGRMVQMSLEKNSIGGKKINVGPFVDYLNELKNKIALTHKEDRAQIEAMIQHLEDVSEPIKLRMNGPPANTIGSTVSVNYPQTGIKPGSTITLPQTGPYGGSTFPRYWGQQKSSGNAFVGGMVQQGTSNIPNQVTVTLPAKFISLKELNAQKQRLQDIADERYLKEGKIFNNGPRAEMAALKTARKMRKEIEKYIETMPNPDLRLIKANKLLSAMHNIEDTRGVRSLLKKDAPIGDLLAAGSGQNPQVLSNIEAMDNFYTQKLGRTVYKNSNGDFVTRKLQINPKTGIPSTENLTNNFKGNAENLSAYRSFSSPDLLPIDSTGKSYTRTNLTTAALRVGLGGAFGTAVTGSPIVGLGGALMASPKAAKIGANVYRGIRQSGPLGYMAVRASTEPSRQERHKAWTSSLSQKVAGTPYEQRFAEALQKGDQATSAEFFKTYFTDPQFQKLYSMEQTNKEIDDMLENGLDEDQTEE